LIVLPGRLWPLPRGPQPRSFRLTAWRRQLPLDSRRLGTRPPPRHRALLRAIARPSACV